MLKRGAGGELCFKSDAPHTLTEEGWETLDEVV
jgi:hypothetical protein